MRTVSAIAVVCLLLTALGCGPKQSQPVQPQSGQAAPRPQAAEPESDRSDLGVFDDPGDLPPCDLDVAVAEGVKFVRYADVTGDEDRECLIVRQHPQEDDEGTPVKPALLTIACWDGEQWEEWLEESAPADEPFVDENTIALARDINEDKYAEVGILVYADGAQGREENFYVWQVLPTHLRDVTDPLLKDVFGQGWQTTEYDMIEIRDVMDEYPGEEIVVVKPSFEVEPAEDGSSAYDIRIYVWTRGYYRTMASAYGADHYEDADAALEAYIDGDFAQNDENNSNIEEEPEYSEDYPPLDDSPMPGPDAPIGKSGGNATQLVAQAEEHLDNGEWDEALKAFEAAVAVAPNDPRARIGRGRTLRGLAEPEEGDVDTKMIDRAVADFSRAIELKKDWAEAYYDRGLARSRMGLAYFMEDGKLGLKAEKALERALDDYARAISIDPGHVEAYLGRGEIYEATGEYGSAIKQYRAVLKLIPGNTTANMGIRRCQREM